MILHHARRVKKFLGKKWNFFRGWKGVWVAGHPGPHMVPPLLYLLLLPNICQSVGVLLMIQQLGTRGIEKTEGGLGCREMANDSFLFFILFFSLFFSN